MLLDQLVQMVLRVPQGLQVLLVQQVLKELQDLLDLQVPLV